MCDIVEMLLRLAVFIGYNEIDRTAGVDDELLRQMWRTLPCPGLGNWRYCAEAVMNVPVADQIMPEIVRPVQIQLKPMLRSQGKEETSLLTLRNQLAHTSVIRGVTAERLVARWAPKMERLLADLAWLGELDLVVRIGLDCFGVLRGPQAEPSGGGFEPPTFGL